MLSWIRYLLVYIHAGKKRLQPLLQFLFRSPVLLPVFLMTASFCAPPSTADARVWEFREFSLDLPEGWDGQEKSGLTSDDRNEYMLNLGIKDESGNQYLAHISLYFLPNRPGKDAHESAMILTRSQADTTEPVQDGIFWVFTGDPRDKYVKGKGTTRVAADAESLLIIIIKDPNNMNTKEILSSLKPLSERAKRLLSTDDHQ